MTFVLVLAVLIHEIRPMPFLEKMNADWTKDLRLQRPSLEKEEKVGLKKYLTIFGWTFGFFLSIFLFGFHIAIAVFTFLFLRIEGKMGWVKALLMAGLTWATVFLIFEWVMGFGLFEGIIFGEIIPLL